jgi:iron complex outermembrane receptor protein
LLYYVDHLAKLRTAGYVRFDTRLGWQATRNLELSVVGQNLFDHRHREFGATPNVNPTSVERSVFGKLTFRF